MIGIPKQTASQPRGASILLAFLVALMLSAPTQSQANSGFIQLRGAIAPPSGAKNICTTYAWACEKARTNRNLSNNDLKLIKDVNRKINRRVRSISDQAQYKKGEVWALPTNRGGDCEDFALLKKRELIALGIDPSRLLLATVFDQRRGAHAVLVVRTEQGDLILDNLTDRIRSWQATRYVFLRMQNPNAPAKWSAVFAQG